MSGKLPIATYFLSKRMSFTFQNSINPLNILGLLLDIIGVYILFKNALPSPIDEMTPHLTINYDAEKDQPVKERIKRNARIGFRLIVIGFIFQLLATIFTFHFCQPS